jgi:hypothetical protein
MTSWILSLSFVVQQSSKQPYLLKLKLFICSCVSGVSAESHVHCCNTFIWIIGSNCLNYVSSRFKCWWYLNLDSWHFYLLISKARFFSFASNLRVQVNGHKMCTRSLHPVPIIPLALGFRVLGSMGRFPY